MQREKAEGAQREETALWNQAGKATNLDLVQTYLDRYPAGRYVAEARNRLAASKKSAPGFSSCQVFNDCVDCPEMVVIPPGNFEMGASIGSADEEPVHTVKIAKAFALGRIEVTQGQWRAMMGNNPSRFPECGDDCPVEKVKWDEVQAYVSKLRSRKKITWTILYLKKSLHTASTAVWVEINRM